MRIRPLTTVLRSTTFFKAFLLNAVASAAIAAFAIAMRDQLEKGVVLDFFKNRYGVKSLMESTKIAIVFVATLLCAMIVYNLLYLLFAFGGGMLTHVKFPDTTYL